MSTMPEGDAAGQQGGQHGTHPGMPPQAGVPSQEQDTGLPQDQDGTAATAAYGPVPAQSRGDAAYQQGDTAYQQGTAPPVTRAEVKVTGRRVVQYLIDSFLVGLVPSL